MYTLTYYKGDLHPKGMLGKKHSETTLEHMRNISKNRSKEKEDIRKEKEVASKLKIGDDGLTTYERVKIKRDLTKATPEYIDNIEPLRKQRISEALLSTEYKEKHYGVNHYRVNHVHIFNTKDELMFCSKGSFATFCDEHKLPYGAFLISARNGTPIYTAKNMQAKAKRYGYEMYIGWYSKNINE